VGNIVLSGDTGADVKGERKMAVETSSIWTQNNASFAELKSNTLSALGRLESAALSIAFSSAIYNDPGDVRDPSGDYERVDLTELPTVADVLDAVRDITAGAFPEPPLTSDITKYKRHVWESSQLDTIESMLMNYITSMGVPSQAFQDSVFDENRERRLRVLNDELDLIAATTSSRGFKYAEGQTNAAILSLLEKDQFDNENLNREITKRITEWAKDNLHFAVQQGVAVETAHMDFAYKYSSIYREIYQTQLNGVLEKFRIEVQQELAKLDAVVKVTKSRADVVAVNAEITGKEDALWLEKSKIERQEAVDRYRITVEDLKNRGTIQVNAAATQAELASKLAQSVANSVIGISPK
jgi:uncharacterized protein YacL (UPF0231 family)